MKITHVETYAVSVGWKNWLFLKVYTDSGLYGILKAAQGLVPDNVVNTDVVDRPGFRGRLARFSENQGLGQLPQ